MLLVQSCTCPWFSTSTTLQRRSIVNRSLNVEEKFSSSGGFQYLQYQVIKICTYILHNGVSTASSSVQEDTYTCSGNKGTETLAIQPRQHRTCSDSSDRMLPSLKTAFTLLSMLQLISSRAVNPPQYQQILKEVILLIQQLNSGVQVNAATPLSFAVLSALVFGDDDVLQCPRYRHCHHRDWSPPGWQEPFPLAQSTPSHVLLGAPWPISA